MTGSFQPLPIDAADLEAALAPAIGGEHIVKVSEQPWGHVADINQPAADSGVATMDVAYDLPNTGKILQLVVDRSGARSDAEMALTLNVTFDNDAPGTVTATFDVPERVPNQSFNFPQGAAAEFIPSVPNRTVKAVLGVAGMVGGATANRFQIVALPDLSSFVRVGCTDQANFKLPVGSSISIPCGLNPSRFTKRGRGEPGSLNVSERWTDYLTGLTRINGFFCSAMVEIIKEERILTDRFVVNNWRPMASPQIGDGDDVVKADAEGNFSDYAVFTAR